MPATEISYSLEEIAIKCILELLHVRNWVEFQVLCRFCAGQGELAECFAVGLEDLEMANLVGELQG